MSKRIFINNQNTFVSKQLVAEFRNDKIPQEGGGFEENPDANVIFGTYIDKDSSIKPDGVKKMLKRSKPRLAMKYLSECDLIIYDLHYGNPHDVRLALDALKKHKSEDEKVLILISSLMGWQGTPKKLKPILNPGEDLAEQKPKATTAEGEEQEEKPEEDEDIDREKGEDDNDEEAVAQDDNEEERIIAEFQPKPKIRRQYEYQSFSELDYAMRNPIEEYRIIKEIEDEVLNFKNETGNVKTYVISAGILYGKGESVFNSHVQKSWLQEPKRLPYVGDGNNLIPTVHVTDLARIVKAVFERKPARKYIFAIDNNKKPTQRKLIASISNGIGTGLIESIDIPSKFKTAHPAMTPIQLDLDWKKTLLLDLKVTPSSLFIKQESVQVAEGEEEGAPELIEIEWVSKEGLPTNIDLIKKEFEKERTLRPMKILLSGPPCSGKTYFGRQLAEHYNVPHIHMQKLIQDLLAWDDEKEKRYQQRIEEWEEKKAQLKFEKEQHESQKELLAQQRALQLQKAREEAEDAPEEPADGEKKENAEGEEVNAVQIPSPDDIALELDSDDDFKPIEIKNKVKAFMAKNGKSARIPEEIINEAVRWRLNRNDCQNRGYVLDGYPRNYSQAKAVFVTMPPPPVKKAPVEGEEEAPVDEEALAEAMKETLQQNIYPESVVILRASEQQIRRRARGLTGNQTENDSSKWEVQKLQKKLKVYNSHNNIALFSSYSLMTPENQFTFPTQKFFQENTTEVFSIDFDGDQYEMFESMRIYIERFGRPNNYLKSNNHLHSEREQYLLEEEAKAEEAAKKENEALKDNNKSPEEQENRQKKEQELMKLVNAHIADLEACDDLNMRQFLMKYIIPLLTEGMIEVWKVSPLDPVDYLADFIYKRSKGA